MSAQTYTCRAVAEADAPALRAIMRAQMQRDPGWPPDYARSEDPAAWLARPADLGRWVAEDGRRRVVGHVGLGRIGNGQAADLLAEALCCGVDDLAEICRRVVDPRGRLHGLGSTLTRRAMRAAIESGRVPAATVLENRGSWLSMMLETGWRDVGRLDSRVPGSGLAVLAPPERFVDLALARSGA